LSEKLAMIIVLIKRPPHFMRLYEREREGEREGEREIDLYIYIYMHRTLHSGVSFL